MSTVRVLGDRVLVGEGDRRVVPVRHIDRDVGRGGRGAVGDRVAEAAGAEARAADLEVISPVAASKLAVPPVMPEIPVTVGTVPSASLSFLSSASMEMTVGTSWTPRTVSSAATGA